MYKIRRTTTPPTFEVIKHTFRRKALFSRILGMQLTNASGVATFDTIYPGWYTGRATHIHVRVHLNGVYVTSTGY